MRSYSNFKKTLALLTLVAPLSLAACGEPATGGLNSDDSSRPLRGGCSGKCDGEGGGYVSPYAADMEKLNALWPGDVAMTEVADAYKVHVSLGEAQFEAPTHLFGVPVEVIPYSDTDGVVDASGATMERGDAAIAEAFPPGVVGFAIKHHRPEYRSLSPADIQADIKEQVKLQDTHIQIVVGVERDGLPGAITLNNPQDYQDGLFGDEVYSMIFVEPDFPEYLTEDQQIAFNDNIRTMTLAFNAISNFPGDYNGGDPLAAHSPEKLQNHVVQMVRAIGGDEQARAFFEDPANQVYCAELAFIGASAGLHFPLNAETMVPLVGEEDWAIFVNEVEKHQAGEASAFTELNENDKAALVAAALAPEDLKPAYSYSADATDARKLAFQPMTMADILAHFLRTHVPREQLGEQVAPVQGQMLQAMKPGLLENMAMDQLPAEDPRRQAVDQLFGALVEVVATPHEDYAAFKQALEPLMDQARQVTGPRDDSGTGYFVPPSLLHVVAQGKQPGGLLNLKYVGHGIHASATYLADSSEQQEEPELDAVEEESPYAGSCTASCGGSSPDGSCWCDDQCAEFGDCCSDLTQQCG